MAILFLGMANVPATAFDGKHAAAVSTLIRQLKENRAPVLVDVRPEREFQAMRIPGSINIPLHAVKARRFLKARPAVLVNQGNGFENLAAQCRKLNPAGFSVSVLYGGLNLWKRLGGPLQGDPFAARRLSTLSPADFHIEKNLDHRIVVEVGKDTVAAIAGLKSRMPETAAEWPPFILAMTEDGRDHDRIEQAFVRENIWNVFMIEGGKNAYNLYVKNLERMHRAGKQRIKHADACADR